MSASVKTAAIEEMIKVAIYALIILEALSYAGVWG